MRQLSKIFEARLVPPNKALPDISKADQFWGAEPTIRKLIERRF
jgi:hypothetical protein